MNRLDQDGFANGVQRRHVEVALLDCAPLGILGVDSASRIIYANPLACNMFGYPPGEMSGLGLDRLIPPAARSAHAAHHRTYFSNPRSGPMGIGLTLTALRRDNTEFPVEVTLGYIEYATLSAADPEPSAAPAPGGITVAVVSDITERRRLEAAETAQAEQIRDLSARLLTSQDEARRRISYELHDGLCQDLALLSMKIGGLALHAPSADIAQELKALQAQAVSATETARQLAHQLHPSTLDDLGVVAALQSLCEESAAESGIRVEFSAHDVPQSLSRELASCFFRIAQQSLRNIIQHAKAARVTVELSSQAGVVTLSVEDDGVGFDIEKVRGRASLGLPGMRERARLVNGCLRIDSRPGGGTRVEVAIPCVRSPQ